jgi:hypothetical protein
MELEHWSRCVGQSGSISGAMAEDEEKRFWLLSLGIGIV